MSVVQERLAFVGILNNSATGGCYEVSQIMHGWNVIGDRGIDRSDGKIIGSGSHEGSDGISLNDVSRIVDSPHSARISS